MRYLHINDLEKLRQVLEDPKYWKYYKWFVGGKVINAEVDMYQHPGGATIEGRGGRWWIYVRVEYVLSENQKEPYVYDIALWKLLNVREIAKTLLEEKIVSLRSKNISDIEREKELISV